MRYKTRKITKYEGWVVFDFLFNVKSSFYDDGIIDYAILNILVIHILLHFHPDISST